MVEINSNSFFQVHVSSYHSGDRTTKGMVFSVEFFNKNKEEIKEKMINFSESINYSNYKYVTTGSDDIPNLELFSILPPESASHMRLRLIQWSFLSNPKGKIEILNQKQKYQNDLSIKPFELLFSCNEYWSYRSNLKFTNHLKKIGRIGILLVRYFDKNNNLLNPLPKEQLAWSKKYGSFFKYFSSGQGEIVIEHEHKFYPPENSVLVEIKVLQWNDSKVRFECETPREDSLQWNHTNKKGLLNESMVSHLAHSISLSKKTELSSQISAKQHHDLLYESHIQTGDLISAQSIVKEEYKKNPNNRISHRLKYINQLISSLDPDWYPSLHSSNKLNSKKEINKVMHLFKVTYPFESTGGSIRNLNIIESQSRAGINPFVVTPLNYPRIFGISEFISEEEINGIKHIRLDYGDTSFKSMSYVCDNLQLNAQLLAGIIRKENPSLIHAASGYKGYELASMAKTLSEHFNIPWIYEVRSFHEHTWTKDVFYANNSWHTKQRIIKENALMNYANHVVTISESMKDALIERGVAKEKITVVPNAVDVNSFNPKPKNKKLIKKLSLSKNKIIGYISNISKREGHEILINSLPKILKKFPEVMILMVGDGSEKQNLISLSNKLKLNDKIIFTGKVDHAEIQDYYRIIDLFVVPRKRDYASDLVTPLKPYEAMALEIPLIVSDRKALLEIIGNDRGFSFKTGDYEDLADTVIKCFSNYDNAKARAKTARKWLIENRTWDKNAQIYKKLYAKLTKGD